MTMTSKTSKPIDLHFAPMGQAADQEPTFTVRAADAFSPHQLFDYAARCEESGLTALADAARAQARRMVTWQQDHGKSLPDVK